MSAGHGDAVEAARRIVAWFDGDPNEEQPCFGQAVLVAKEFLALAEGIREWMPIETAPRDGTEILVWDGFGVVMAAYRKFPEFAEWVAATGSQGATADALDYAEDVAQNPDGWSAFESLSGDELTIEPTHWQPPPSPPSG